ncbi:MAG: class I SAM-dependent methyltransferase [Gemmataceae bacterium]|nr:class I SAM-dependent methyltransferase [Gemmata sp.]MDW8199525.1 class I SAM-dependent methyltransferase [Gemmataceae bacterium]
MMEPLVSSPRMAQKAICLYCGGSELQLAYRGVRDRLGFVPGEREFWQCQECGSLVLHPIPRWEEVASFYPPVYTFTYDLAEANSLKRRLTRWEYRAFYRPQYHGQANIVLRHLAHQPPPGRKLLDIGCGRGLRLLEFRARGWDVHGADFDSACVHYLRHTLGIPAVCADAASVGQHYPHHSFDLVTAFHLLEHLPDVSSVLAVGFDLLKPGGWLAIACPLADNPGLRLFGTHWCAVSEAPRHMTIPSRRGLILAAMNHGFQNPTVLPDHFFQCAATYALSAVPMANTTSAMARGFVGALTARLLGGIGLIGGLLARAIEITSGAAPSCGILLARKPAREAAPEVVS